MQTSRRRRGFTIGLLSLGLLAGVALTASQAQAQTTSVGPYYAMPSWDQTLPVGTRFIVLSNFNNEAVLDRETGLVWERSPQTAGVTWTNARSDCAGRRTTGNRKGWRLPSVHELASLIDPANSNPPLPTGHPFTNVHSAVGPAIGTNYYWSATTNADDPTLAWIVHFGLGGAASTFKTSTLYAWCVRGGGPLSEY